MNAKKTLSMTLAAAMAAGLLAGCGGSASSTAATSTETASSATTEAEATTDSDKPFAGTTLTWYTTLNGNVSDNFANLGDTPWAKYVEEQTGITIVMVGHVTKEGALAGPRVLEHIVDSVLYFEGDTHSSFRMIRAIKNRFGAVNELGVFAMTDRGLRGVSNPSAIFLSSHRDDVPGSCVLVTQEGTRPLLVEIQALVDEAHAPQPRRLSVGLEQNRLAMLLAVLHRHAGVACFDQDVFVNAVGGVKISEPAADLAVLLAIASSLRNRPLPAKMVVFGEVGLAGEVRPVQRGQERLKEAAKLGFTRAIVPAANQPKGGIEGMEIVAVERLDEAVAACRDA